MSHHRNSWRRGSFSPSAGPHFHPVQNCGHGESVGRAGWAHTGWSGYPGTWPKRQFVVLVRSCMYQSEPLGPPGRCWWEFVVGLNGDLVCHMSGSVVYCVADCCAGGQRGSHVWFAVLVVAWDGCGSPATARAVQFRRALLVGIRCWIEWRIFVCHTYASVVCCWLLCWRAERKPCVIRGSGCCVGWVKKLQLQIWQFSYLGHCWWGFVVGLNDEFCLSHVCFCMVLLIVVLEGRGETMCDSQFWLLRGLVWKPSNSNSSSVPLSVFGGNCWIEWRMFVFCVDFNCLITLQMLCWRAERNLRARNGLAYCVLIYPPLPLARSRSRSLIGHRSFQLCV